MRSCPVCQKLIRIKAGVPEDQPCYICKEARRKRSSQEKMTTRFVSEEEFSAYIMSLYNSQPSSGMIRKIIAEVAKIKEQEK